MHSRAIFALEREVEEAEDEEEAGEVDEEDEEDDEVDADDEFEGSEAEDGLEDEADAAALVAPPAIFVFFFFLPFLGMPFTIEAQRSKSINDGFSIKASNVKLIQHKYKPIALTRSECEPQSNEIIFTLSQFEAFRPRMHHISFLYQTNHFKFYCLNFGCLATDLP
jgi:hypothetical protein